MPEEVRRKLNPTGDPDRDRMLASYEQLKHGGLDDFRTKLLARSIGEPVTIYQNRAPATRGVLIHFDEQYGQLVVEGKKHSPPELTILLLSTVTKITVGDAGLRKKK